LERTLASLPGYFYSTGSDGVYVHLYDNSERNWRLNDGNGLKIKQETNYPWSGEIKITVSPTMPSEFVVYVRIPGWSARSVVNVNGVPVSGARSGEYLAIRRHWLANDTIKMNLDLTAQLLKANPDVSEDRGRVAFQRGPIVFCMEHLDRAGHERTMNLVGYTVRLDGSTTAHFDPNLLDGVMVLSHSGSISQIPAEMGLYQSLHKFLLHNK
jgi:hypothetical protein